MACQRLKLSAKPIDRWHRLWCAECRSARSADAAIFVGLARMKAESAPAEGLSRTLAALDLTAAPRATRKPRRRAALLRLSLPAGAFTGAVALMGAGWLYWIDIDPNVKVPNPTLPSPNAYDFYCKAAQYLVTDEHGITETMSGVLKNTAPSGIPALAYESLERSTKDVTGTPNPSKYGFSTGTVYLLQRNATLLKADTLLKMNAQALDLVHQGLKYPYYEPPARTIEHQFTHYPKLRTLARLLALEGQTKAARHDWAGAFSSDLDAMQLGIQIMRGGPIMGRNVGIGCEGIGRRPLWQLVDRLNASQARAMAQRLERLNDPVSSRVSMTDSLQEEEWMEQAILEEEFRMPYWRKLVLEGPVGPSDSPLTVYFRYIKMLGYSKRRILNDYTAYMDQQILSVEYQPYAGWRAMQSEWMPDDPVVQNLLPVFSLFRFWDANNSAQDALLLTTLALRAYRLDHGCYPQSLKELTPDYLHLVPNDPFAASVTPLHYRRTATKYILYSVGPDRADDKGTRIDDRRSLSPEQRLRVRPDSSGDIVAGVNIVVDNND